MASYCSAAPGSAVNAALLASRMPSTSNMAGSGKPAAKLMMPGLPSNEEFADGGGFDVVESVGKMQRHGEKRFVGRKNLAS